MCLQPGSIWKLTVQTTWAQIRITAEEALEHRWFKRQLQWLEPEHVDQVPSAATPCDCLQLERMLIVLDYEDVVMLVGPRCYVKSEAHKEVLRILTMWKPLVSKIQKLFLSVTTK